MPFNILEAQRAGLTVIASRVKGQTDLVASEYLYEPNDIEAFAQLVKNAKQTSVDVSKYEMQNAFPKNIEIYRQCAKISEPAHRNMKEVI